MSAARRIQLSMMAVVFLVTLAGGVGVAIAVRASLVQQVDDQLVDGADTLRDLDGVLDEEGLALLALTGEQPDRASAILVFDAGGGVVLTVPSGTRAAPDPVPDVGRIGVDVLARRSGPATVHAVDGSLDYRAVGITSDGATLILATPLRQVDATMGRVRTGLLASALVSVLVIGLAISFITRRAIRPVDEMIASAEAIGRGDLTRRIETTSQEAEVTRLSGALNDMLRQLEESFAARQASEDRLRRFVADASHELRTPMASIRGYSELYLSGAAADQAGTEKAMTRIRSEAVRTGDLVEDLLLLARLDESRDVGQDPVDLVRLVTESVDDARAIEPDRSIDLHLDQDLVGHGATVAGDEAQLRQAVANLLANTRAHAAGAAVRVAVTSTTTAGATSHDGDADIDADRGTEVDAGFVTVSVADDGPGMTTEQAAHVFDRFWRADESRNRRTGGAGLGLAITAAIVGAHRGTIEVVAASGQGATFAVHLPLAGAAEQPLPE